MKRVAIAVSRFNEEITSQLLSNCLNAFAAAGWDPSQLKVVHVPGGFELPWTVNELARAGRYDAVIALGCVLKGETPQNDHIARSLIFSLHQISVEARLPVILGVITPNTWEQALARTRGELDRGKEAALAAIEMVSRREEFRGKA